jgi:hypothetical protein
VAILLLEQLIEGVETRCPFGTLRFDPLAGVVEGACVEGEQMFLAGAAASDEASAFEDADVLRDAVEGDRERARYVGDAGFAVRETLEDGAARGVGEGEHGGVKHFLS